jgi:hypothetical protein
VAPIPAATPPPVPEPLIKDVAAPAALPAEHVAYPSITASSSSPPVIPPLVITKSVYKLDEQSQFVLFMTQPQHRAIVKYAILPYLMGFIHKDNGIDRCANIETFKVSMISRRMHNLVNEMIGSSFPKEGAKYHEIESFMAMLHAKPHREEEEEKQQDAGTLMQNNLARAGMVSIDTLWRNPVFGGSFLDPVGGRGPSSRPNSIKSKLIASAKSKDGLHLLHLRNIKVADKITMEVSILVDETTLNLEQLTFISSMHYDAEKDFKRVQNLLNGVGRCVSYKTEPGQSS